MIKDKVDLVMWTKNGERTLPINLASINRGIPSEKINQKIIIDDHSTDDTRDIAENMGWQVIFNEGTGISDGANTALKNVETEYFCSFEQDVILSKEWWQKVAVPLLDTQEYDVASGLRFNYKPKSLADFQKYTTSEYVNRTKSTGRYKGNAMPIFLMGKTLDNTIYRTEAMKYIDGFPNIGTNAGIDMVLAYRLELLGCGWRVNFDCHSIHLRKGLADELEHQYWYGMQIESIHKALAKEGIQVPITSMDLLRRFATSPLSGFMVGLRSRNPSAIYIYPLMRYYYLKGFLKGGH